MVKEIFQVYKRVIAEARWLGVWGVPVTLYV